MAVLEILTWHPQHAKAFPIVLVEVFVMHFMGATNGFEISIVGFSQNLKALMDENIVHKKVTKSIQGDAQTDPKQIIISGLHPKKQSGNTGQSKNQKEKIIVLEKPLGDFFMVIFMQDPKQAVHDVFMGKPGHKLHAQKSKNDNADIE